MYKLCDFGKRSTDVMGPLKEKKETKRETFNIYVRNTKSCKDHRNA